MQDTDTYELTTLVNMDKELGEPVNGEGLFKCKNGEDTCTLCGKSYKHNNTPGKEMELLEKMYDHMMKKHYDWHIMWTLAYDRSGK